MLPLVRAFATDSAAPASAIVGNSVRDRTFTCGLRQLYYLRCIGQITTASGPSSYGAIAMFTPFAAADSRVVEDDGSADGGRVGPPAENACRPDRYTERREQ